MSYYLVSSLLIAVSLFGNAFSIVRDSYGCPYVYVEHNRKKELFLVDTGFSVSAYDYKNGPFFSVNRDASGYKGININLFSGTFMLSPAQEDLSILEKVNIGGSEHSIRGILGMDILIKLKGAIDLNSAEFIRDNDDIKRLTMSRRVEHLLSNRNNLMFIIITSGNSKYCMMLDTGCTHSVVDCNYRSLLLDIKQNNQSFNGTGAGLPLRTEFGYMKDAVVAGVSMKNDNFLVADLSRFSFIGTQIDEIKCIGMLGCDWILRHKIIININDKCIYIK